MMLNVCWIDIKSGKSIFNKRSAVYLKDKKGNMNVKFTPYL